MLSGHWSVALIIAESALLTILHHRFDFWGWSLDKQAIVIFVAAPALAFGIQFAIAPAWHDITQIRWPRWLRFLVPALVIAALTAQHFLAMPEVQHRLEIRPSGASGAAVYRLQEVRAAYGNTVPLSTFAGNGGWSLQQGLLVSRDAAPSPIAYSFVGPIQEQVRVTFLALPQGGQAQVVVDGRQSIVNLAGPDGDQRRARLDTQYRWGALNFLIMPLTFLLDMLTVLWLLAALWLMQELLRRPRLPEGVATSDRFLSHAHGLLLVCLLAFVLHTISFLSVPLSVLKDSPSYLQGAVYWAQHHSLDGVSSYRGLGTTLLFAPIMSVFGRNPLGVKLLLHVLALACVPLSYWLGWRLERRRWFAFAAALLTALLPDLYSYAGLVLSEIPYVFASLLYCALLLTALEYLSFGWALASLLAGAFLVLVRPDGSALLLIGAVLLVARWIWLRRSQQAQPRSAASTARLRWWHLPLAVVIAAAPLVAWSVHNRQVHGFFGLSDYAGEILWDGWVYFGDNSPISVTDHASPALQVIDSVRGKETPSPGDVPTGWTVYYDLLDHGYASEQAFSLLQQAAIDSIRKDPAQTWRLLLFKIRQGFEPHATGQATFLFPGEAYQGAPLFNSEYFDQEHLFIPPLIRAQRFMGAVVAPIYSRVMAVWLWFGLIMLFICLYRQPFFLWFPIVALAVSSILLPTVIGMSMWRYLLLGILLLVSPILAGLQSLAGFVQRYWWQPLSAKTLPGTTAAGQ